MDIYNVPQSLEDASISHVMDSVDASIDALDISVEDCIHEAEVMARRLGMIVASEVVIAKPVRLPVAYLDV